MTDKRRLKIAVVSSLSILPDAGTDLIQRARPFHIGLLQRDYEILPILQPDAELGRQIARLQPEVLIVDAGADGSLALQHVLDVTADAPLPIICFTDDGDQARMRAALHAGVAAYVMASFSAERVRSVLGVAMARFQINQKMHAELAEAKKKAAAVKVKKASRTANRGSMEDEVYRKLRCLATDKNLSLSDIAKRMMEVAELLV